MLTIEIKVNGKLIATAEALNISSCANVSDYDVDWTHKGIYAGQNTNGAGRIRNHCRDRGAWELVRRVAGMIVGKE